MLITNTGRRYVGARVQMPGWVTNPESVQLIRGQQMTLQLASQDVNMDQLVMGQGPLIVEQAGQALLMVRLKASKAPIHINSSCLWVLLIVAVSWILFIGVMMILIILKNVQISG